MSFSELRRYERSRGIVAYFGLVTVAFWLSFIPYLPPVLPGEGIKRAAREAREIACQYGTALCLPQQDVESVVMRDFRTEFGIHATIIAVGMISGLLLWRGRRLGLILALSYCAILFIVITLKMIQEYGSLREYFVVHFTLFDHLSAETIHREIIAPAFLLLTLAFLTRKSVIRRFAAE